MMGQLRHALRAYLVEGHEPAAALSRLDTLVERSGPGTLATVACVAYDPRTGVLEYSSAGHPPPLVMAPGEPPRFLEHPLGLPVGVMPDAAYQQRRVALAPGSVLLLYTDGLVEDRELPIGEGMDRLRAEMLPGTDIDRWLEAVVDRMTARRAVDDDVAALALVVESHGGGMLLRRDANAVELAGVRSAVREGLEAAGQSGAIVDDIVLAASEAAGNVVRHAYDGTPGLLEVAMTIKAGQVHLTVHDEGRWREADEQGRRGLQIMHELMDAVELETTDTGTTVRMSRRLTG
jgi:anti-sigma regulatory factor (Ser/Thr protein kinase)